MTGSNGYWKNKDVVEDHGRKDRRKVTREKESMGFAT